MLVPLGMLKVIYSGSEQEGRSGKSSLAASSSP